MQNFIKFFNNNHYFTSLNQFSFFRDQGKYSSQLFFLNLQLCFPFQMDVSIFYMRFQQHLEILFTISSWLFFVKYQIKELPSRFFIYFPWKKKLLMADTTNDDILHNYNEKMVFFYVITNNAAFKHVFSWISQLKWFFVLKDICLSYRIYLESFMHSSNWFFNTFFFVLLSFSLKQKLFLSL